MLGTLVCQATIYSHLIFSSFSTYTAPHPHLPIPWNKTPAALTASSPPVTCCQGQLHLQAAPWAPSEKGDPPEHRTLLSMTLCLIHMPLPHPHLLSYPPSHCSEGNRRESRFGRRATWEALGFRVALVHPNRNGGGLQRWLTECSPPGIRTDRGGEAWESFRRASVSRPCSESVCCRPGLVSWPSRAPVKPLVSDSTSSFSPKWPLGALPSWATQPPPQLHYCHVCVYVNKFISKGKSLQ